MANKVTDNAGAPAVVVNALVQVSPFLAPTPWTVDKDSVHSHWTNSVSVVDAEGGEICILTRGYEGDKNGDDCPSWTNAYLITAAPKMLAALQLVAAQLSSIDNIANEEACSAVRAAIAEAASPQ